MFQNVKGDIRRLEILKVLIVIRFDLAKESNLPYISRDNWVAILEDLNSYFKLLSLPDLALSKLVIYIREIETSEKPETIAYDAFCTHFDSLESELQKSFKF